MCRCSPALAHPLWRHPRPLWRHPRPRFPRKTGARRPAARREPDDPQRQQLPPRRVLLPPAAHDGHDTAALRPPCWRRISAWRRVQVPEGRSLGGADGGCSLTRSLCRSCGGVSAGDVCGGLRCWSSNQDPCSQVRAGPRTSQPLLIHQIGNTLVLNLSPNAASRSTTKDG